MFKNRTEYYSIDFCKYIMNIFVVAIHTNSLVYCQNVSMNNINNVLSLVVPFFFISSVFLFSNRIKELP